MKQIRFWLLVFVAYLVGLPLLYALLHLLIYGNLPKW